MLLTSLTGCVTRTIYVVAPPDDGKGGSGAQVAGGHGADVEAPPATPDYVAVVDRVAQMVSDRAVVERARRRGLDVVNVAWEDTGRDEGSSVGPNITDLTLQVRMRDGDRSRAALMPVVRFPNFDDRTGDVPADKLFVRVGNEKMGGKLRSVALTDMLRNLRAFASVPQSLVGSGNMLAPRDTHFLVSAQAVFLPIPKQGAAQFNPVVFNYQSSPGSPAVLTILVTREGTSVRVIENAPEELDPSGAGQELYFNNGGQRAAFTAERRSDVKARIEAQGGPKTESEATALAKGADVLMLVQVPLVSSAPRRFSAPMAAAPEAAMAAPGDSGGAAAAPSARAEKSDVEQAVLGHGPDRGPYSEGSGARLVRDARFPIRITVQFYKATSNGVVDDKDLDLIAANIGSVYEHADFVGSLVVPEGDPIRPTSWQRIPPQWFPW